MFARKQFLGVMFASYEVFVIECVMALLKNKLLDVRWVLLIYW